MEKGKILGNKTAFPVVSIITVVRNGEKVLERTIKSIISQTYPNIEYIIIDGSSQDGTLNIIKKYESHISLWISEPDKSHFDAMNKGLKLAKGDYVWFIHAGDEIYNKDTLEKVFESERYADAYYGETIKTSLDGKELGFLGRNRIPEQLSWKGMRRGMAVCHQSIIIRKSLVGQYSLDYPINADLDWIISALKKSERIVNTRLILSKYLAGGISAQHEYASWLDRFKILNKHFGMPRNLFNHFQICISYLIYKVFKR